MTAEGPAVAPREAFLLRAAVGHTLLARVRGPRIVHLAFVSPTADLDVGQWRAGRVVRLADGLEAAFVDVGAGRPAFLPVADVTDLQARPPGRRPARSRIRQRLAEGQRVLVEVKRPPSADKGARITTRVAATGRFVVASLDGPGVALSRQLADPARRSALEEWARPLAEELGVHLLLRTAAAHAALNAVAAEARVLAGRLLAEWRRLASSGPLGARPGPNRAAAAWLLEEGYGPHVPLYAEPLSMVEPLLAAFPDAEADAEADAGGAVPPRPLADWRGADGERALTQTLDKALAREVHLGSGGTLVVERTAALWAIDVNSGHALGGASGKRAKEERLPALARLNAEAAAAAGEHIVLANLGGIVAIDFIDSERERCGEGVHEALRHALAAGKARAYVSRMNELGLVSLTRSQRRPSLMDQVLVACPCCHEPAAAWAPWYVATRALWALAGRAGGDGAGGRLLLQCAPEVAEALHSEGAALLAGWEAALSLTLVPVAREGWPASTFEWLDERRPGSPLRGGLQQRKPTPSAGAALCRPGAK